ncbi:MAG: DEAD/DEAH box helicase [Candidatus Diapherotrites archaeon]
MDLENKVLEANSFPGFNPMQKKVLDRDWKNKNLVVGAPTASGKTVVAELAALNSIIERKRKVVYTCPLRALASEHFSDFKKKYSQYLNIRACQSTGDLDSSSKYLSTYDIIYTTYEKLDSLTRHGADWLQQIGLLVVDEIHEIDSGRGPTLEMLITKLRIMNPKMQVLALSATIPNAKELAKWLDAELVESDYRPVKLSEGVYFDDEIDFRERKEGIEPQRDAIASLVGDTLKKEKQALIFANTRRRSEGIAKQLAPIIEKKLNANEKRHLTTSALKILNALESPTEQCRSLAKLVEKGVGFHNAGLLQKQREIVEELFRENYLKVLSSTTTLAAGINLPAFRVIIPSLYRYTSLGNQRINISEYKQCAGRAGRPKYDSSGEAILIAKNEMEVDDLFETYIDGEIEEVNSKLGIEPILRTHLLAAIASNFVYDLASMEEFFSKTFYAVQYRQLDELFAKIMGLIQELEEMKFVESDEKRISATVLGKRVSELYLDPKSAYDLIVALNRGKTNTLFYLFSFVNTYELHPLVTVPKKKEPELWEQIQEDKGKLPINVDVEMFSDPDLLKKFNTALLFQDWLGEVTEENLSKEYNVRPGILHTKLRIADWLVYCAFELSRLQKMEKHLPELNKLRKRLKYGIREELVYLTEVRNIGRVRARRLWNAGIKGIADLKKTRVQDLAKVISPAIAVKVKEQLGEKFTPAQLVEIRGIQNQKQKTIFDS